MKTAERIAIGLAAAICSGCATQPPRTLMATPQYAAKEPISASLFPSDQAVLGEEAINRILSSKLELPAKAKLAVMKLPEGEGLGFSCWQNEQYLKLQQAQVEALSGALLASEQILEVTPLPSLMTPRQVSIPVLREAAVRMQADLLVVFRVGSDGYAQYRAFSKDRVKAYSACELVLLDVRTGLVPFTKVTGRDQTELKQASELDLSETMRQAEEKSSAAALRAAAEDLVAFLKTVPRKGS